MSTFTAFFQHLLYASLPPSFPSYLLDFLAHSLASLSITLGDDNGSEEPQRAVAPSPHLHRLNVLPRFATSLMRVAYDEIEKIAREAAALGWEERRLQTARKTVSDSVVAWMSSVFESECCQWVRVPVLNNQTTRTPRPCYGQFTRASTTISAKPSLTFGVYLICSS